MRLDHEVASPRKEALAVAKLTNTLEQANATRAARPDGAAAIRPAQDRSIRSASKAREGSWIPGSPPSASPRNHAARDSNFACANIASSLIGRRISGPIEEARGRIDYDESGSGPTVVLAPGSCSTGAAWRSVIGAWNGQFRCVTTSLLGYGGTAERRTAGDHGIAHEAKVLESEIGRAHV